MQTAPGRPVHVIDPFAGHLSPKLAKGIRELLVGPRVQEINFDFSSVLVHAVHFKEVARMFVSGLHDKGIHVVVHPVFLFGEKAQAIYMSAYDSFYFESSEVLEDDEGRAVAVHECVHAVCDYRRRNTAIRSEEGAAMLAEAWYRLTSDDVVVFDGLGDVIWEVADRLRKRWLATRLPVPLRNSEINAVRAAAARDGYENGHYYNNGIIGA